MQDKSTSHFGVIDPVMDSVDFSVGQTLTMTHIKVVQKEFGISMQSTSFTNIKVYCFLFFFSSISFLDRNTDLNQKMSNTITYRIQDN